VPVSILEDMVATGLSLLAVIVPVLVAALIIVITAYIVWLLWRRANSTQPA
jgi:threonine/homoserine/homoserine lactone efflux protein